MTNFDWTHECGAHLTFTIHEGEVIDGPEICFCGEYINPIEVEKDYAKATTKER